MELTLIFNVFKIPAEQNDLIALIEAVFHSIRKGGQLLQNQQAQSLKTNTFRSCFSKQPEVRHEFNCQSQLV